MCCDLREKEKLYCSRKWTLSGGGMLDRGRPLALLRAACGSPQSTGRVGLGGSWASSSQPQKPLYPKGSLRCADQEDPGLRSQDPQVQTSGLSNALFSDVGMCI